MDNMKEFIEFKVILDILRSIQLKFKIFKELKELKGKYNILKSW
jgi:hypothetical protein